jgi:hypothetical protein
VLGCKGARGVAIASECRTLHEPCIDGSYSVEAGRFGYDDAIVRARVQFIEAVEKRDHRKTKHVGFFVNAGSVERVGEKPVKVRRKRKPLDIEAASASAAAPPASSSTAVPATAPAEGQAQQRPAKAQRPGSAPAATQPQAASSVAQMAMTAAREAAARPGDGVPLQLAPPGGVVAVNTTLQQVSTSNIVLFDNVALSVGPRFTWYVAFGVRGTAALR